MDCIQRIDKDIYWVGGSDRRLALFENMFPLDNGVTYNAYMIVDEKTALVDTVDNAIALNGLFRTGNADADTARILRINVIQSFADFNMIARRRCTGCRRGG